MSALADSIKDLRKRLKLNQTEFAELMGVKQSAVSKWENGNAAPEYEPMLKLQELGLNSEISAEESKAQVFGPDQHSLRAFRDIEIKVMGAINNHRPVKSWRWASKNDIDVVVPYVDEWDGLQIVGFYVQPSHSQDIPFAPGSIAFVALYGYGGLEPADDDLIVFEKRLQDGAVVVGARFARVAPASGDVTVQPFQPQVWDRPYEEVTFARCDLMKRGFAHFGLLGVVIGGLSNESWRLQRHLGGRRRHS